MTDNDDSASTIPIAASPAAVWAVLTEPHHLRAWMNGADVRSSWQPGAAIEIDVVLERRPFRDRGTVIESVPGRRLSYSYWSEVSRLPDTPATRSVITFDIAATAGGTTLSVRQTNPGRRVAAAHWQFWWPTALATIRDLAEGREPVRPIAIVDG